MGAPRVSLDREAGRATLVLQRPPLNILNIAMLEELEALKSHLAARQARLTAHLDDLQPDASDRSVGATSPGARCAARLRRVQPERAHARPGRWSQAQA